MTNYRSEIPLRCAECNAEQIIELELEFGLVVVLIVLIFWKGRLFNKGSFVLGNL